MSEKIKAIKIVNCIECGRPFEQLTHSKHICSPECETNRRRRAAREYYKANHKEVVARKAVKRKREKFVDPLKVEGGYVPPEKRKVDSLDAKIMACGGAKAYEEKRKAEALAMVGPIQIPADLLLKHEKRQKV